MNDRRARLREGFTLLELLVVVAIIGLLASMLLPAVSRAKSAAYMTICKNNLKQQSLALQMYVQDTGYFPTYSLNRMASGDEEFGWIYSINEYSGKTVGSTDNTPRVLSGTPAKTIFSCPSYARIANRYFAYGYNCKGVSERGELGLLGARLGTFIRSAADIAPVKEDRVVSPSRMVALGDAIVATLRDFDTLKGTHDISHGIQIGRGLYTQTANPELSKPRHRGQWNMAFCDGHVEVFESPEIFDNLNPEVRRLWNNDNQAHPEFPPVPF